jgi:hypothetical protein
MQYYSATLKNDAILQRDTKKRCNITSARSQVRGHKNTQISHYLGVIIKIDAKSMRHLKNDAILQRDTKKRCNITARTKKRCNITARH